MHLPLTHDWIALHFTLQSPQLFLSAAVLTQNPPHCTSPCAQTQVPTAQISPTPHAFPHLPQLALSVSVVVQKETPASLVQSVSPPPASGPASTPPQLVEHMPFEHTCPALHTVPQLPQFALSVIVVAQ
jgi:hypothetical protein